MSQRIDARFFIAGLIALASTFIPGLAKATDGTWTNTAAGSWGTTTNWSSGIVANGAAGTANFNTIDPTADITVTNDANRTIGNLIFGDIDTSSAAGWTVSSNTLNLDNTGGSGAPTITVNALGTGKAVTISSVLSGSGGLNKAGVGTLILSGVNTISGITTITNGTLQLGAATALQNSTLDLSNASGVFSFGTLTAATLGGLQGNQSLALTNTTSAAVTLTVGNNNGNTTYSGTLSGTGGALTKIGSGILTLNANQTYTGTTTITGGGVTLGTGSALALSSASFASAGGTLTINNAASGVNFSSGTTLSNGASKVVATNSTGTDAFGTITRNVGGTVDFTLPTATGTIAVANANTSSNIIGAWATVAGTDWATKTGVGNNIGAYTGYTPDTWSAGSNTDVTTTDNFTGTGVKTTNSVRFNNPAGTSITLDTGVNTLSSGGILMTSAMGSTPASITGGTLTTPSGQDLIVHQNNTGAALTIGSIITSTGTAAGLTKDGAGTLILNNTNTFTGGVNVNGGTLDTSAAGTVLAKQIVTLSGGGTWNLISGGSGALSGWGLNTSGTAQPPAYNAAIGAVFVAAGQIGTLAPTGSVNVGQVGGGAGSTLNVVMQNSTTFQAMGSWATNAPGASNAGGSLANLNLSVGTPGNTARFVFNASTSNVVNNVDRYGTASLTNTALNIGDGVTVFARSGSGGLVGTGSANSIQLGSLSGNSTAVFAGGGGSGGVVANYQIGSLNTNTEYAGTITSENITTFGSAAGGTNITKIGTGTLTLSGNLIYTANGSRPAPSLRGGITTISAGTLAVKNGATLAGGSAADQTNASNPTSLVIGSAGTFDTSLTTNTYTDGNGTPGVVGYSTQPLQQVLGTGTIAGNYNHGAGVLAPGDSVNASSTATITLPVFNTPAIGTLTFKNNLSFSGTGDVKFDLGTTNTSGNDLIVAGGGLLTGTPVFDFNFFTGTPAVGSYTIISSPSGGLTGDVSGWTVGNWPGRAKPTFTMTANAVTINIATVNLPSPGINWSNAAGDGIWNIQTSANWFNTQVGATNPDVYVNGDAVNFNDTFDGVNAPTSSTITLNDPVSPTTVTVNNSVLSYSISGGGKITGSSKLIKHGSGTLTLTTGNDYTGTTLIDGGGTIDLGSGGKIGTGALTMTGGTILGGNSSLSIPNTTITASTTNTISFNGSGGASTLGSLSGSGNLNLNGTGSGETTTLSSNNSGFTGTMTINHLGVIRLPAGSTSAATYPIIQNAGTIASDSGSNTDIGSLTGGAAAILAGFSGGSTSVPKSWTIGALNQPTTYAGTITNGKTNQPVSITKAGTASWTLSGTNTFSGTTTVNAGTLVLASTGALQDSTLATGGTGLVFDQSVTSHQFAIGGLTGSNNLNLLDNATPTPNVIALSVGGVTANVTSEYAGVITGSGSLTKTGTGTYTVDVDQNYTGGTAINNGNLAVKTAGGFGPSGLISFGGGTLMYGTGNTTDYSSRFSTADNQQYRVDTNGAATPINWASNLTSNGGSFTKRGAGTLALTGNNTYGGGTNIVLGTLQMGSNTALGASTGNLTLSGGTLDMNNHNLSAGSLSGTAGTVTNSQSGAVTLTIGTGDATPATPFVASIQNGSGTVALTKTGAGSVTLSGVNTYTGNTTINGGTVVLGVTNSISGTGGTFSNLVLGGGTLDSGNFTNQFGSLKVNANSAINQSGFGTIVHFTDSSGTSWAPNARLEIDNWNGNPVTGGGGDQVLFDLGSGAGLSPGQLNEIKFPGYKLGATLVSTATPGTSEIVPSSPALQYGDINFDGVVNVADIRALMTALSGLSDYINNNDLINNEPNMVADINFDGMITNLDIQAEISLVANGQPPGPGSLPAGGIAPSGVTAVPEPASFVLLALGGLALAAGRYRRNRK